MSDKKNDQGPLPGRKRTWEVWVHRNIARDLQESHSASVHLDNWPHANRVAATLTLHKPKAKP